MVFKSKQLLFFTFYSILLAFLGVIVMKKNEITFEEKLKYQNKRINDLKWLYSLISEMKFDKAYSEYQNYFESFPDNYFARIGYIDLLLKMSRFDEASEVFTLVKAHFDELEEKSKNFLSFLELRYLCCINDWESAYKFLKTDEYLYLDHEERVFEVLLCKKLDIPCKEDYTLSKERYVYDLAHNYDYGAVMNHIVHGHTLYDEDFDKDNSYFDKSVDLIKLYDEVKDKLSSNIRICWDLTTDHYIFKYDNVGLCDNSNTNYFRVITFVGTDQILTMYPCNSYGFPNCLDITPEIVNDGKVKRLTGLDKFNKRYGKNID